MTRRVLYCPKCGSKNLEALIRSGAYATYQVVEARDGKLVLAAEPLEEWVEGEDLDQDLKCLDCAAEVDCEFFTELEDGAYRIQKARAARA